jgi:fumarate reductase subunit D
MAMIGAIVAAVLSAVIGVAFQLGMLVPKHHSISRHALVAWGLAVVFLVGASFARPQRD